MKQYILLRDRQERGPFTAQELRQQSVMPNDLVWVDGESTHWQKVSTLSELADSGASSFAEGRISSTNQFQQTAFAPEAAQVVASPLAWTENARQRTEAVPQRDTKGNLKWIGLGGIALLAGYFIFNAIDKKNNVLIADNTLSSATALTAPTGVTKDNKKTVDANAKAWGTKAAAALKKIRRPGELKKGISLTNNDYETGFFGGISDLQITVKNTSAYAAERVKVKIDYLRPNNDIVESKIITVRNVGAGADKTVPVEDSKRGVRIVTTITGIQ